MAKGPLETTSTVSAGSLRTIRRLGTALVLVAIVSAAIAALQLRELISGSARTEDIATRGANAAADQTNELKRTAERLERAIATMNRQAAALEGANKIAVDALSAGRRAWVGVADARIEGALEANADLNFTVDYRNTGHEPATNLALVETPIVIDGEKRADPSTMSRLEQFAQRCLAEDYVGAMIAFPTGDFQNYQASAVLKASDVDQDLVDGRKIVVLQGCIVYMTEGVVRHSASCLYFQSGKTRLVRFPTCAKGNEAD